MLTKNNIFWHICQLNNWKNIVTDQYDTIQKSGLIEHVDNIFISFIGKNENAINFLLKNNIKFQLINFSQKYIEYERVTLHKLRDWSCNNDSNILYIHTKGISRHKNNNVWLWRKMIEHVLINHYRECIKKLDNYDVISINLCDGGKDDTIHDEQHKMHFSGNFWWSKTSHIKNLPRIRDDYDNLRINKRYWLCERWIMCNYPNSSYYEIYRSPQTHYYQTLPPPIETIKLNA